MAPAFIALEKGFFTQEGVDFTFTELDSGALGAAAVISGNAQISDLDPLGVARLQQEGKPLLLVYNLVGRVTLDLIVRTGVAQRLGLTAETPLAARYAALKGLTIGITRPGAPTDVFARYFWCARASILTATPRSSRSAAYRRWPRRSRASASTRSSSRRRSRRRSSARGRAAS
jgi:ABC-type nitrate/sulfonate/bicarbonate transport system substrate-binding protein